MEEVFGAAPLLVPVPRSSRPVEGGIWPAYNIASALVANGIGAAVLPCLQRVKAVPKSAFAASGTRPKPLDHYESIVAVNMVADRQQLCLVDDVITKGATLLAAASRLRETYPHAKIVAFALVRTLGSWRTSIGSSNLPSGRSLFAATRRYASRSWRRDIDCESWKAARVGKQLWRALLS